MSERWLPVVGYEGFYEVSDQGRVRRVNSRLRGDGLIALNLDHKGYPKAHLCVEGKRKRHLVHRLVCRAFHGEPPENTEAGHRNGIRGDARADNVRWVTRSENNKDTILHGNWKPPLSGRSRSEHPQAKYSDEVMLQIIADMECGFGSRRISKKYGISQSYAGRIKRSLREASET